MRPYAPPSIGPVGTPTFGVSRRTSNSGSVSSSSGEDELPITPRLPPGAVPPEPRSWAVSSDLKGLGMSGILLPRLNSVSPPKQPELIARQSEDSLASEAGSLAESLGGESTATAASSDPSTPTRLQFVSDNFDALSKPTSLDELTRLRAAAKQLDLETQRLRRNKVAAPATVRKVPRKAVPIITEAELAAPPKPRRAAVRHSLINPREGGYSFLVDPLPPPRPLPTCSGEPPKDHPFVAQATTLAEARAIAKLKSAAADGLGAIVAPPQSLAARRQAFYSQGKVAQSSIEISTPRAREEWTPPRFLAMRPLSDPAKRADPKSTPPAPVSRAAPAQPSKLRGHTPASPAAPGPPVTVLPTQLPLPAPSLPVVPVTHAPVVDYTSIPIPPIPEAAPAPPTPNRKSSLNLLKNKKLSRLFGKTSA